MNPYKCIIPFFTAFAICFSTMATPSSASLVPVPGYQPVDFSTMASVSAINNPDLDIFENASGYLATLYEAMTTGECDGCAESPVGKHNFMPSEVLTQSWAVALMGEDACVCRYCGISYRDFYDSTYDQYVTDLPGTVINSDGSFFLPIPVRDWDNGVSPEYASQYPPHYTFTYSLNHYHASGLFKGTGNNLNVYFGPVYAPCNGYYTRVHEYTKSSSISFGNFVTYYNSRGHVMAGTELVGDPQYYGKLQIYGNSDEVGTIDGYAWYLVEPDVPLSDDVFHVTSRPTSIVGDYGIIGDDGTITKVDGNLIVDESTNTVYNPVTNTTYNFTDYAYDYSDRSYNLTLEDGSTMKVVYGDENVTINEGDTVYNVYYLIQDPNGSGDTGGGSGGGFGDGSGLGDAVGGFLGALGDILAGLISGLLSLATKALEALTGLGDLFAQMVETVLGFFGGFIDFLSAMFPFLPEETITILNLGLILMIAAAVFNRFFK